MDTTGSYLARVYRQRKLLFNCHLRASMIAPESKERWSVPKTLMAVAHKEDFE